MSANRFAVLCTKPSGAVIVFSVHDRRADAERQAAALINVGLPNARVEKARSSDTPGAGR
jgi:hypothetical protein